METQTDLTGEEDKDASSSTEPNDAIEDASEKKDDAAPPLEEVSAEAETTGSNDTKSADSQTDLPGDDEKDASSSTGSNDDIEDASEKKEDTKSADSTDAKYYRGVRVENVIRTGKIHWVSNQKKRCTIVQDRKYRDIGPLKAAKVTVSFPMFNPILHKIDDDYWKPTIAEGRRVQFQAKKQKGGGDYLVGFNVRYEGGRDIPMLNLRGSVALIKKAKAALGHSVYNVLSESALSAEGEGDIAKKVKLEFDKHNRRMAEAREQSGDPSKTSKEIKAKLGDEIYDLITNIATVDSIERRADDAYYRCVKKLQELAPTYAKRRPAHWERWVLKL